MSYCTLKEEYATQLRFIADDNHEMAHYWKYTNII